MTRRQTRGSAMIEFTIVAPIITLFGLAILQYGMLFFGKNQINHATFMAARAGSTGNANAAAVRSAYIKALIPLYGGGRNSAELAEAYGKALADTAANLRVEVLNPTEESFDDFNDAALEARYGARAIANSGQAYRDPNAIGAASGQSIQDANLIKLRITHGYEPKVPLVNAIYRTYLHWLDPGTDAFHTQLVDAGRIPVVANVTLQMQSDPVEDANASTPGSGNHGTPQNQADPPLSAAEPPHCATLGCSVAYTPVDPGGGGGDIGGVGWSCK